MEEEAEAEEDEEVSWQELQAVHKVSYTLGLYSTPSSDQSYEVHSKLFFIKTLAEIFVTQRFVLSVARTVWRERIASQHAVQHLYVQKYIFHCSVDGMWHYAERINNKAQFLRAHKTLVGIPQENRTLGRPKDGTNCNCNLWLFMIVYDYYSRIYSNRTRYVTYLRGY